MNIHLNALKYIKIIILLKKEELDIEKYDKGYNIIKDGIKDTFILQMIISIFLI